MSVLLRQPHGFEGLGLVRVGRASHDDLAVPELVDINVGDIHDCDPLALPAAASSAMTHDHVVARVDVLARISSPELVEALAAIRDVSEPR